MKYGLLLLVGLAMGAFAGSFAATVMWRGAVGADGAAPGASVGKGGDLSHHQALREWLDLSADRAEATRAADPDFEKDAEAMEGALGAARDRLADLLEMGNASDGEILSQVEAVIAAHDALERRVARHVLAIRPQLTVEQQKRLMLALAGEVRSQGRRRRGGRGGGEDGGPGAGRGPGGGPGGGGGGPGGGGYGRQRRGEAGGS